MSLLSTVGPILARWGLFVSITLMLGAVALRVVVLGRWKGATPWPQAIAGADETSATLGLIAAVGLMLAAPLILLDQILLFRDPFSTFGAELKLLVTGTSWGRAWQLQFSSAVLATVAFVTVRVRRGTKGAWAFAALATLFCATTPALSGHSAGTDRFHVLAVGADALHVITAGAWLGTLAAMMIAMRVAVRRGTSASEGLPGAVASFSSFALLCAGTLVSTGLFASWLHVGSVGGLFTSGYGRVLLMKGALVSVVAALGAYNWKRVTPGLGSPEGSKTFMAKSAPAELLVGLLVLLVTAILVAMTHPMEP